MHIVVLHRAVSVPCARCASGTLGVAAGPPSAGGADAPHEYRRSRGGGAGRQAWAKQTCGPCNLSVRQPITHVHRPRHCAGARRGPGRARGRGALPTALLTIRPTVKACAGQGKGLPGDAADKAPFQDPTTSDEASCTAVLTTIYVSACPPCCQVVGPSAAGRPTLPATLPATCPPPRGRGGSRG